MRNETVFYIITSYIGTEKQTTVAGFLLGLFFYPEDKGDIFFRNVG
jgi:hypothetical protein